MMEDPRHLIVMTDPHPGPSDRHVRAAYGFVEHEAIVTAHAQIIQDRAIGRAALTSFGNNRNFRMQRERERFAAENPGVRVYRNVQAMADVETRTNAAMFFYPELFLEYTPTRNGSLTTFYANFNNIESRRVGEFLFITENGVRIEGDLASRFQRGSNRLNQRAHRNARPILMINGNDVQMVVVATRNIAIGDEIIL